MSECIAKSVSTVNGPGISREAENRADRVAKFHDFVRYTFPDESMLVIASSGEVFVYGPNEEGDS